MVDDSTTITRSFNGLVHDAEVAPAPRLIVAFQGDRPLCPGLRLSLSEVDEVIVGRGSEREWCRHGRQLQLALPDRSMSRHHVRLRRMHDGWHLSDADSKNGTYVDGVRVTRCRLFDGIVIEIGRTLCVYRDRASPGWEPAD